MRLATEKQLDYIQALEIQKGLNGRELIGMSVQQASAYIHELLTGEIKKVSVAKNRKSEVIYAQRIDAEMDNELMQRIHGD